MAKKVIDIIPPQNYSANVKPIVTPETIETKLPGVKISAAETISSDNSNPNIIENNNIITPANSSNTNFPNTSSTQSEIPSSSNVVPPLKPRVTFMGRPQDIQSIKKNTDPSFGRQIKKWTGGLLLTLIIVGAVMCFIDWKTARANVKIWPTTTILSDKTQAIVDPSIQEANLEKGTIPGLIITAQDTITGQSPVTGKKDTQGKATGTVKIFNDYTITQTLVKNTRLEAAREKFNPPLAGDETPWFRITSNVVLAPKSSATVTVIADYPGEKYNIEPSVFSLPGLVGTPQYTYVYAQSYQKFQGGSTGSAPSVTQADLDNAKQMISDLAKSEIEKKLQLQISEGLELIPESKKYEFGNADVQAKLGDSLGEITSQMSAKVTAIAYRKADIDNLGKSFILSKVPAGSLAYQPKMEISSAYKGLDSATGNYLLEINAAVPIYRGLEDNELKKGLSEKSAQEAKIFLEDQGMKIQTKFTPFWRHNFPRELDRIEVQTLIE